MRYKNIFKELINDFGLVLSMFPLNSGDPMLKESSLKLQQHRELKVHKNSTKISTMQSKILTSNVVEEIQQGGGQNSLENWGNFRNGPMEPFSKSNTPTSQRSDGPSSAPIE